MNDDMSRKLLRKDEAAERPGVSLSTVRRLRERGELPVVKIAPHCFRFESEAIEAFIRSRRVAGP